MIIFYLNYFFFRDKEKPQESGVGGVYEVSSKPVFQKIPESQEAREGQTVRFDCYVTGRPYPEITWYKNDVELYTDDLHKVRNYFIMM